MANDSIFFVERLALPENVVRKICDHLGAIVGMYEGGPTLNGAHILFADSKQMVQNVRTCPHSGTDIHDIASQTSDALRLAQRLLALAKCRLSCHLPGDIPHHTKQANHVSIEVSDRIFPVVYPPLLPVPLRRDQGVAHHLVSGKDVPFKPVIDVRKFFASCSNRLSAAFPPTLAGSLVYCPRTQRIFPSA